MPKIPIKPFANIPEKMRLLIVASIGAVLGWLTYEFLFFILPTAQHKAVYSWILNYIIGVFRQHWLHKKITFTQDVPYWSSLGKAFVYYLSSGIFCGIMDFIFVEVFHINYRISWFLCLILAAILGLLFLKKTVFTPKPCTGENIT